MSPAAARRILKIRTTVRCDTSPHHKTVHASAVDIPHSIDDLVRPAVVHIGVIGERTHTRPASRIREARGRNSVLHRDPVRTRIRPEVVIERPILLHDHNDMLDLVDPGQRLSATSRSITRAYGYDRNHRARDTPNEPHALPPAAKTAA